MSYKVGVVSKFTEFCILILLASSKFYLYDILKARPIIVFFLRKWQQRLAYWIHSDCDSGVGIWRRY